MRIKELTDFPGYYVTVDGRVLSTVASSRYKNRHWLKQRMQNSGYNIVSIHKDKKAYTRLVHRLVAVAFIPNTEDKCCVNHMDGRKTNNLVSNLEWNTLGENHRHAYATGLRSKSQPHLDQYRGQSHSEDTKNKLALMRQKITKEKAQMVRDELTKKTMTCKQIMSKYKIGGGTLNMCKNNSFRAFNLT